MTAASTLLLRHARSIGRFEHPTEDTDAARTAADRFEANRAALDGVWPRTVLALPDSLPELEWLYARDGTLSARHVDGQWFGDVTVPRRAAERMLSKVAVAGNAAVLLAPTHAQQIRVVLDRTQPNQAVLVVIPGEFTAGVILASEDFSADIRAHRLWLACGPDWWQELSAILEKQDGLSPPSMMIRVPGLNAAAVDLIHKPCDAILARHAQAHRQMLTLLHAKPRAVSTPPRRICVSSGPFRLWDDAGSLLGAMARRSVDVECVTYDARDPAQASTLGLARAADGCDAFVAANVGRADQPQVVPANVPWVTWVTNERIPSADPTATRDRLILVDESQVTPATAAGWRRDQIEIGAEPTRSPHRTRDAVAAIIADVRPIVVPKSVDEMSSHRVVWELARRELLADPLGIGRAGVDDFLLGCADRVGVPRDSLPLETFRCELVTPLFAAEIARGLRRHGVAFAIYGSGWGDVPELADRWRGPVRSPEDLAAALGSTSAIIDVWPGTALHAARRAGRPTVRTWGRSWATIVSDVRSSALRTRSGPVVAESWTIDRIAQSLG